MRTIDKINYKREIEVRNKLIKGLIRIIVEKNIDDLYIEEILLKANELSNSIGNNNGK